jgi:heme-degrading monooxygenase HmoA
MITMFVRHTVDDFDTWHKAVEEFAPTLRANGVVGSAFYRSVDDPNDLTVAHDFETLEAARAFAESDELRTARPKAGVKGDLNVWFAKKF